MVCSYSEQRNLLMLISLYDQKIPELEILVEQGCEISLCIPPGLPCLNDTKPETYWIYFLAQTSPPTQILYFFSARTTWMWLVGFRILLALPMARGRNLFSTVPAFT